MAPKRAIAYIRSFELPEEEETFLIECDVRRKSYIQAASDHATTPETIKRRRQRAYSKIIDQLDNN